MARTIPIPTSVRAAMDVSVSPRPCIRATAAPAWPLWTSIRLAASASTCARSWARRSFFHVSTSASLPIATRKSAASSMFALSCAARCSLARRVASRARRRASTLDVAVMGAERRRPQGDRATTTATFASQDFSPHGVHPPPLTLPNSHSPRRSPPAPHPTPAVATVDRHHPGRPHTSCIQGCFLRVV